MIEFPKLSIPGFNSIIEGMKVPLANPWGAQSVPDSLAGLDLVHMQFPFFLGVSVCRAAKSQGIPLICSFHVQPENLLRNLRLNSPLLAKALYKLFIWSMYRHADLVLAPSEFAAEQLRLHGLERPIEVLSNGVPESFFNLERKPHGKDKFQILSVGRMAPEKHHQLIFDAIGQCRHSREIELTLIGAGPLEQQLRDSIQRLGIDAKMSAASDAELAEAYRSADLFVHAGEIELEGMSVLEAMAAGNAVVVSDSKDSAAVEFVPDQRALFSSRSAQDLANKIDYWLDEPNERDEVGKVNRELARLKHHDKSVTQLKAIYHRVHSQGAAQQ
jgi:glycosyltransferase involved in cell wall biosynthesis